jgi:branched-chain amino acid transport system ATP-binding protein
MLTVRDLHAFYGKSHILRGIDLDVREREIVSVLGRNGVGRSTLLKAIMGNVASRGSIVFRGRQVVGLKAFEIARAGIGYVPEDRAVFPTLSVEQNLVLGEKKISGALRWTMTDTYARFPQLKERAHVAAGALSGGEQQMLTICRTLMGNPDLILIDEPTEGLSPQMVERCAGLLLDIAQRNISILLVEQRLTIALRISHRVYVLGHGAVVFRGAPEELGRNGDIQRQWLTV